MISINSNANLRKFIKALATNLSKFTYIDCDLVFFEFFEFTPRSRQLYKAYKFTKALAAALSKFTYIDFDLELVEFFEFYGAAGNFTIL